jgi:hypothetical protein
VSAGGRFEPLQTLRNLKDEPTKQEVRFLFSKTRGNSKGDSLQPFLVKKNARFIIYFLQRLMNRTTTKHVCRG